MPLSSPPPPQPQADPGRAALTVLRLRRGSLWTGHSDGTVREWHLASMTCIRSLAGHKAAVRDLQPTAKRVATVSDDAFVRLWEFRVPPPSAPENDLVKARLLDQSDPPQPKALPASLPTHPLLPPPQQQPLMKSQQQQQNQRSRRQGHRAPGSVGSVGSSSLLLGSSDLPL